MTPSGGLHLAVFVEPYLTYLLSGRKTVESRFSVVRCAPYERVAAGDAILLKLSGGPVIGVCEVRDAWFYRLDKSSWRELRQEYAAALCAQDPQFWTDRANASFATLMSVGRVLKLPPISWPKKDRRGWVVLHENRAGTLYE